MKKYAILAVALVVGFLVFRWVSRLMVYGFVGTVLFFVGLGAYLYLSRRRQ